VVGAGGSGIRDTSGASNGGNSSISAIGLSTIISSGGGQGGANENKPVLQTGYSGGCGGGGGINSGGIGASFSGGSGSNGGAGGTGRYDGTLIICGGGGGASGANGGGTATNTCFGGTGKITTIINTTIATDDNIGEVNLGSIYFGGGGAGGSRDEGDVSRGGLGGGGDAFQFDGLSSQENGAVNTGGGCGGIGSTSTTTFGGSGCVIIRMATSNYSGNKTGNPLVRTIGSDTILIYTGSGTYTA